MTAQGDELKRLLLAEGVVSLPRVIDALECSRRTAMRRLCEVGYLSSYSHAGRFYALAEAARFDSFGLWQCGEVHFSRYGTLKATVAELVERSGAGWRPRELAARTGVRCYNVLGELVRAGRVHRGAVAGTGAAFYFSVHAARRARQIERREEQVERERPLAQRFPRPAMGWRAALAVVVELVKSPEAGPATVAGRLRACGLEVSARQVREVFATYALDKKRAR